MKNLFASKMNELTVGETLGLSIAVGLATVIVSSVSVYAPAIVEVVKEKKNHKGDEKKEVN